MEVEMTSCIFWDNHDLDDRMITDIYHSHVVTTEGRLRHDGVLSFIQV